MRKTIIMILATMFLNVSGTVICHAEEAAPLTLDTSVSFLSDYMFRGFNLYDGTSIQPSLKVNYDAGEIGNFHAAAWMHLSGESDRQGDKFSELDLTVTYDKSVGPLTFTLGHVWYTYPSEPDEVDILESNEFFAGVSYDTFLTPTLTIYHDYREFDAQYYDLLLSHTIEISSLGEGFNMTPFVNFGFGSNSEKVYDENGLEQVTYGVSSQLSLGDIAVTPTINFTQEVDDLTVNEFWFGTTFGMSF